MRVPFAPPPGLNSDDTTFASPGVWEDGNNVRFWHGRPQVIGGWQDLGVTLTGVCRNLLSWKDNDGNIQIAFGTHSKLQLLAGGALYDITPVGLIEGSIDGLSDGPGWGSGTWSSGVWGDGGAVYYARTWALSTYGNYLIANPRRGGIYQWTGNTSNPATIVTNAPTEVNYSIVTPQRQIMALGCNEEVGGAYNQLCIRWSDIEDIIDWTTSSSNNAGEHILEGGGRIVAAANIGAYIAIWTDKALHLGQFVGDPGQTYRFDLISNQCGLIGPNAFAIVDQTAYWVGSDYQFRSWSVGGPVQILPCPIHRDFSENIVTAQIDKVVGSTISQFGEVWWHYPDTRDGIENSRYVVFSSIESNRNQRPVWFRGTLARTAASDAGATAYPVHVTYGGIPYYHENGVSADGSALDYHIRSADTYVEEGGRRVMVRAIEPDFEDLDDSVSLTVYARDYPRATATALGPHTITTATTKKTFRASGRLVAIKLSGSSTTPTMRLGKPVFDAVPLGQR